MDNRNIAGFSMMVNGQRIKCLVDTGAHIPVFTRGADNLKMYFPDAERKYTMRAEINGFGNKDKSTSGDVYEIHRLKLYSSYDSDYIAFENMNIVCCARDDIWKGLILPYNIFDMMDLMFINNGESRELCLRHTQAVYNCGFSTINSGQLIKVTANVQSIEETENM
jgi:hypothetical protein